MAYDVFLSHSAKDKAVADAICARMEADGVRCWVAPRDIRPGHEWGEAIMDAIGTCPLMVLVLSQHANESPQVRREVERAIHRGVMVIPFRIEEMEPTGSMEYFLSAPHWLDAIQPPLEDHIARLAETAKTLLGQAAATNEEPASPAPPPPSPADSPNRRGLLLVGAVLAAIAVIVTLFALLGGDDPVPVVVSNPPNGATDVPLDLEYLRLIFARPMMQGSYTFCESGDGVYPLADGAWRSEQVLEMRLLPLEPHTTYAFQLNSEQRQNFRYADTDEPLPVTAIVFTTGKD